MLGKTAEIVSIVLELLAEIALLPFKVIKAVAGIISAARR